MKDATLACVNCNKTIYNGIYSQTSSNALNIKAKGRSRKHAGIAAGAGHFKLKSVEREKVNMYGRGGKM